MWFNLTGCLVELIAMTRIQNYIVTCLAAATLLVATAAHAGETVKVTVQSSGKIATVKSKSALCQGCHGEFGLSLDDWIPNHAGQYAGYFAKQFRNFQSGVRTHQIMSELALTITDADLADIGAYFASQKKMQGNGKGDNRAGRDLFLKGDRAEISSPA